MSKCGFNKEGNFKEKERKVFFRGFFGRFWLVEVCVGFGG